MAKRAPMSGEQISALAGVLAEVAEERQRQHAKWGEQSHLDFPREPSRLEHQNLKVARDIVELATRMERLTYEDILLEEVAEVRVERDTARLRAELVQVAAVACQWVEAIDRRGGR